MTKHGQCKRKKVTEYIASQPEAAEVALKRVRGVIRKALPRAEEVIAYKMPAYVMPGGTVAVLCRLEAALCGVSRNPASGGVPQGSNRTVQGP